MPYECNTCETKFRYKISLRTHKCTKYMGNERTAVTTTTATATTNTATTTTKAAAAAAASPIVKTSKTVNDDAVMTFMDNDQPSMSTCQHQQSLDELITDSCNRMGIGSGDDRIDDSNQAESSLICIAKNENGITENDDVDAVAAINAATNQSMLQFDCDSFNLNDLAFCTSNESNSNDLANVIPSMNEMIFPQSIEMLNAFYDNNVSSAANNNDLQHFYNNNNNSSITNSTSIATPPPLLLQPQPPPPPPQQQ